MSQGTRLSGQPARHSTGQGAGHGSGGHFGLGAPLALARARGAAGGWFGLAVLAGVLHTASFSPTEAWFLQPLALAGLVWLARAARPARAALLGWGFGLGWLVSGLWWLYISMHQYGGLPPPVAGAAVLLLSAALALYPAGALAAWAAWGGRSGWPRVPVFAACWLAAELARASWFTGFPWIASGYAHTSGPLAAWAPWVGVYGITALAAALAAALGLALGPAGGAGRAGAWAALLAVAALVGAGSALPAAFTRGTGTLSVSLVQPNIAQDLKFDVNRLGAHQAQLAQAVAQARGQLVVTPESVVPLPFELVDPAYWQGLQAAVAQPGRAALVGVFLADGAGRYVNSLVGLDAASRPAEGRFYQYGKRHLLPFGEFIPPGFGWFVRAMAIPLDDQAAGRQEAPLALAGQRLRPLICYEDLFGEDFVASVRGPQAATVLVNASNLAWFGTRMVQDQHLQFSRMRALEFERPVVRSTNTGATAVVDHHGQVTHRLPPAVAATLEAQVEGRLGDTPYARWLHAAGLWPLWALVLAVLAAAWGRARRT